jgi:Tfp pilus assembly protein PilO
MKKSFQIEDYLRTLDQNLNQKAQKEIYMIYIMIFAGLFAFSYLLFWDTSVQAFEKRLEKTQTLKQQIQMDKIFLQVNTPAVITKIDNQIENTKKELIKYKDNNAFIKSSIESISFLFYDEKKWGDYLNSIDKKANKYDIKILELQNSYNTTGEAFGHVLDISINTAGKYKDTLKFINALEQSDLVVDIHDLNISAHDFLESDINISVWGIRQ